MKLEKKKIHSNINIQILLYIQLYISIYSIYIDVTFPTRNALFRTYSFLSFVIKKNHYFCLAWKNWKGWGESKKSKNYGTCGGGSFPVVHQVDSETCVHCPTSLDFSINGFTTPTRDRRTASFYTVFLIK